jgi:F-type H+-transporting ATPase subunit delta
METALTPGILTSLPGRYAKAIFDLAKEKKQVGGIGSSLNSLNELIKASKDLKRVLANPTISHEEQIGALSEICKKMKTPALFLSFVELLVKSGRISYLSKIDEIYHDLMIQEKGEEKVEVISAYPLTTAQVTLLKDKLKKVFPRTLNLTFINDTNVLGGVMVRVGCRVIDATLVTQLNQLATVMKGKA